ncbi:MAG: peptide chain release factor N(5)-glutamine methyltransferase [Erythrobacter sp.]
MIIAEAIRAAAEQLSASSDTARLDAELLMAHALGVTRSDLLLRLAGEDREVPKSFGSYIKRRRLQEPVAYIIGNQEFYGRTFEVSGDVLIPRGDSETLIEASLKAKPDAKRILDLGTGSGALIITILLELPQATGIGIDFSRLALAVAERNAGKLGLDGKQVKFEQVSWHEEDWRNGLGQFDLIVANPPYVETNAALARDVAGFEPSIALFAGETGLDEYRVLLPQLRPLMNAGGRAAIEIGSNQAQAVDTIATRAGFEVELHNDLAGRARVLTLS